MKEKYSQMVSSLEDKNAILKVEQVKLREEIEESHHKSVNKIISEISKLGKLLFLLFKAKYCYISEANTKLFNPSYL